MSTQSTVAPFKVFIHGGEIIAVIAPCRFEMAETHVDCFHCSTSGDAGAEYGATQIIKLTNEITLEEFERLNPRGAVEYFEHMGEDPRLRAPKQEASAYNHSNIADRLLDDGDMGEFLRGELGAVACDDGDEAVKIIDEVISKLTAMRNHVAIREAAERIDAMNCTCAIDKDVETHSEAVRIIHGCQANWLQNEAECDDVWSYPRHPVYTQLRNLIK